MPIPRSNPIDLSGLKNYKNKSIARNCFCNTTKEDIVKEFIAEPHSCISTGSMPTDEYIDSVLRGESK